MIKIRRIHALSQAEKRALRRHMRARNRNREIYAILRSAYSCLLLGYMSNS